MIPPLGNERPKLVRTTIGTFGHGRRVSRRSESKVKGKSEGKSEGQIDYFRVWHK